MRRDKTKCATKEKHALAHTKSTLKGFKKTHCKTEASGGHTHTAPTHDTGSASERKAKIRSGTAYEGED